jgi:hypothetical protein
VTCLQPSASNRHTKQQFDGQKDSTAQVTCDGTPAFSAAISEEKPKENGNEAGGQRELQHKPCGLAQRWTPESPSFEHRQEHDQPDRKMNQQRMKATEELKPISTGTSV